MTIMKPNNLGSYKTDLSEKLTSAELGKLWATYMGNSMGNCILRYFLRHVDDEDIKALLTHALKLTEDFVSVSKELLSKENCPIPSGFSEEDVNVEAPRLFEDEFYVHYLKYVAKAGMSIYTVAIPIVFREDVRDFFTHCMNATLNLMEEIKGILMHKGLIMKPPLIPVPEKVEVVQKDFLNGFFGHVRPLHALEIAHFYDNIENNVTSKALVMAFAQVARDEKIRKLFEHGKDITTTDVETYMEKMHNEDLPTPTFLDDLVTSSTFSPFSDRLMLFHKMDMFSMKIRSFGNSVAVNGRHDLVLLYSKSLTKISAFVEDATKLMIENGWMEHPPHAVERG